MKAVIVGCGRVGTFDCWQAPYVGFRCNANGPIATAGGAQPASYGALPQSMGAHPVAAQPIAAGPRTWSPELGQELHAQIAPRALACVGPSAPLVVTVEYQLDGRAARVGGHESLPPEQQACVRAAVESIAVKPAQGCASSTSGTSVQA